MSTKQTNIRGRWCWYFVTLLLLIIGEAIQQNEASIMFPDDWEEIKLKLDSQMQEPSSNDSDSSDTEGIAPVVPLEEPDMSEDDAEVFNHVLSIYS